MAILPTDNLTSATLTDTFPNKTCGWPINLSIYWEIYPQCQMETFIGCEYKISEAEPPLYQFYSQACGEPFTSFQYDQAAIFTSCRYFFALHNIKIIQHKVLILAIGYFI